MNTIKLLKQKKGISPIIATLLLILIAIAAGVIVYAYVVGFIGASTNNSGGTVNTLSIDQVSLSSKATTVPVTAYVRNEGPSTESFNTGFFVKGSALNDVLGVAVDLVPAFTTPSTDTVTISSVNITQTTDNSHIIVTVHTSACTATTDEFQIAIFNIAAGAGPVTTGTCTVFGAGTLVTSSIALTSTGITVSTGFDSSTAPTALAQVIAGTVAGAIVGTSTTADGTTTTGTMSVAINTVGAFTLAPLGYQAVSPLSSGQTYTVQVTGTDGASTVASAKAS